MDVHVECWRDECWNRRPLLMGHPRINGHFCGCATCSYIQVSTVASLVARKNPSMTISCALALCGCAGDGNWVFARVGHCASLRGHQSEPELPADGPRAWLAGCGKGLRRRRLTPCFRRRGRLLGDSRQNFEKMICIHQHILKRYAVFVYVDHIQYFQRIMQRLTLVMRAQNPR
jgi:hypothetical protein